MPGPRGSKPLPPHKNGDPNSAARFNAFEQRAITEVTVGPGMTMARSGSTVTVGVVREGVARPATAVRVKVTTVSPGGDTTLVLVKRFDGTTESGEEFPVRKGKVHVVGQELYVFQPQGGVIDDPTYNSEPVTWQAQIPVHMFPVNVTQVGGVAGSKTQQCSFSYDVTDADGTLLHSNAVPEMARPAVGKRIAATIGMAYWSGGLALRWVDEVDDVVGCT